MFPDWQNVCLPSFYRWNKPGHIAFISLFRLFARRRPGPEFLVLLSNRVPGLWVLQDPACQCGARVAIVDRGLPLDLLDGPSRGTASGDIGRVKANSLA